MKVLLFPLSNVLGHVDRCFALAEAFDAQGHDVTLVLSASFRPLRAALAPTIRLLEGLEMVHPHDGGIGLLHATDSGAGNAEELRRRSRQLNKVLERDHEILQSVQPDVVICDWHFTPWLLEDVPRERLIPLTNLLGFASLHAASEGTLPFPLANARILVPGIPELERTQAVQHTETTADIRYCGPLFWNGWERLHPALQEPSPTDVFAAFGSTGFEDLLPGHVVEQLETRLRIGGLSIGLSDLNPHLQRTDVALCHGGHGTVMRALSAGVPVLVLPMNPEQLEIGRRLEQLHLGAVIEGPRSELDANLLLRHIDYLRSDPSVRDQVALISERISQQDGPASAVTVILEWAGVHSR